MEITVLDGQSLFDIAIQECGSVAGAFALAVENNVSVSNEIASSTLLVPSLVINKRIVDYFDKKQIKPATWSRSNEVQLTGIGYMVIEENFTINDN